MPVSIVLFDFAARRKPAALLGHALDMTAKLDLLSQQRLAGTAIFGAFVGIAKAAGFRELGGGFQGGTARGFQAGTAHGIDLRLISTRPRYKTFLRCQIRQGGEIFFRRSKGRVPDAVQRSSRCSAEPGPTQLVAWMGPGSAAHRFALRSIRGT